MEFLKGKTPDIMSKEIKMFFIVYNVIKLLMYDAKGMAKAEALAFKSCAQTLLSFCNEVELNLNIRNELIRSKLLKEIAKCALYQRPDRVEPRQVKRRLKPFKLMAKPRSVF